MAVRTAKQKAALRKAQLASARKRRGHGHVAPAKAAPKKQSWGDRHAGAISIGASLVGAAGISYMQYKFDQHDKKVAAYKKGRANIRAAADERRHRRMNYADKNKPRHMFYGSYKSFANSRRVGSTVSHYSHHGGKTKLRRWGTGGGKNRLGKGRGRIRSSKR